MSDTNSNAFRIEAAEKRTEGRRLLNEAEVLDAKAVALEGNDVPVVAPTVAPPPAHGANYTPDVTDKKTK